MNFNSYIRKPDFCDDYFVFISDDDLWKVEENFSELDFDKELHAIRLTTNHSKVTQAKISPNGSFIAYISDESGELDCYIISRFGGEIQRVSYFGDTRLIGWKDDSTIWVSSSIDDYKNSSLKEICTDTLEVTDFNYGPVDYYSEGNFGQVISRMTSDIAFWKNYKGGWAGQVWYKKKRNKNFTRLLANFKSDISKVMVDGFDLYYLTDKNGSGNIESLNLKTMKTSKRTSFNDYYVRDYVVKSGDLLFTKGGSLFYKAANSKDSFELSIILISSFEESRKRFVSTKQFLSSYTGNSDASLLLSVVRGKLYSMKPWIGPAKEIEINGAVRFKDVIGTSNESEFYAVFVDKNGLDNITKISLDSSGKLEKDQALLKSDIGKIDQIKVTKNRKFVLVTTFRYEIFVIELSSKKITKIDKGEGVFRGFDVSRDSNWVVYSKDIKGINELWVYNITSKKTRQLLKSVNSDVNPMFDVTEDYLYFVGSREYKAKYFESHFDMGFPDVKKPYVLNLNLKQQPIFDIPLNSQKQTDDREDKKNELWTHCDAEYSPVGVKNSVNKTPKKKEVKKSAGKKKKTSKNNNNLLIDFDNLDTRVQPFPFKAGGWEEIMVSEDRIFFERDYDSNHKIDIEEDSLDSKLISYTKEDGSIEVVLEDFESGMISGDGKSIITYTDHDLRIFPADSKPAEGCEYSRRDGWVEIDRIRAGIDPKEEWRQIYTEAWSLQKENFYNPKKTDIDFDKIYHKYLPLLDKVNTRSELSDLIRDMQGDLQTSHAYEYFGDYLYRSRNETIGRLGAVLRYIRSKKCYKIDRILKGDTWNSKECSPLESMNASLKEGDEIYKVDGKELSDYQSINRILEKKENEYVELEVLRKGSKKKELVETVTLDKKSKLSYRNWVHRNREIVHKATKGKIGYIHIPDMSEYGFSEFYRSLLEEQSKSGIIVDVRFNEGGNVSQHILKILSQKQLGSMENKWSTHTSPYPMFSCLGKLVGIANGQAGSDGDIFSYAFKKMKLGPLVGTRTWGGVIGIWPKSKMVDGTIVTQPEYNFEFDDKSGVIENYGVKPDIEVEITPDDWFSGVDPQLQKAISIISEIN